MYHNILKMKQDEKRITVRDVAERLELSEYTTRKKINRPGSFTWSEIVELCELLGIENPLGVIGINTIPQNDAGSTYIITGCRKASNNNDDPLIVAHKKLYRAVTDHYTRYGTRPKALLAFREKSHEMYMMYKRAEISAGEYEKWLTEAENEHIIRSED